MNSAVITFKVREEEFSVYSHHDGEPTSILPKIIAAKAYAWKLPRFEADDFAAAYITAHKGIGGGTICCSHGPQAHKDLSYHYIVTADGHDQWLIVEIHEHRRNQPPEITQRRI